MNIVVLTGNLVAPPTKKKVGEKDLAEFSIAVNDGDDHASFFDCKAWNGWAKNLSADKGAALVVEGRLVQERWTDKTTGENRAKVVVVASSVRELAKKAAAPARQQEAVTAEA